MIAPKGPGALAKVRGKEKIPEPTMDPTTMAVSAGSVSFCTDSEVIHRLLPLLQEWLSSWASVQLKPTLASPALFRGRDDPAQGRARPFRHGHGVRIPLAPAPTCSLRGVARDMSRTVVLAVLALAWLLIGCDGGEPTMFPAPIAIP